MLKPKALIMGHMFQHSCDIEVHNWAQELRAFCEALGYTPVEAYYSQFPRTKLSNWPHKLVIVGPSLNNKGIDMIVVPTEWPVAKMQEVHPPELIRNKGIWQRAELSKGLIESFDGPIQLFTQDNRPGYCHPDWLSDRRLPYHSFVTNWSLDDRLKYLQSLFYATPGNYVRMADTRPRRYKMHFSSYQHCNSRARCLEAYGPSDRRSVVVNGKDACAMGNAFSMHRPDEMLSFYELEQLARTAQSTLLHLAKELCQPNGWITPRIVQAYKWGQLLVVPACYSHMYSWMPDGWCVYTESSSQTDELLKQTNWEVLMARQQNFVENHILGLTRYEAYA